MLMFAVTQPWGGISAVRSWMKGAPIGKTIPHTIVGPGSREATKVPPQPGVPHWTIVISSPPAGVPTIHPAAAPPPAGGAFPIHPPALVGPPPLNLKTAFAL